MLSVYLQMFWYYLRPAFSFLKKGLIISLVLFVAIQTFLFFWSKDIKKNITPDTNKVYSDAFYQMINDKELNKSEQGKMVVGFAKGMFCIAIGEGCTNSPKDAQAHRSNSFIGWTTNIVTMPIHQPVASGVQWAYSGLQQAGFVPQTYAASGIGFASLSPFFTLWKTFRNFAFLLMVVIMIVIGFMVMFRAKLNAQTVISVENALPRLVIAMLLITFSFAIAGFMIDMMYVVMGFIIQLFGAANPNIFYAPTELGTTTNLIGNVSIPDINAVNVAKSTSISPTSYINRIFFSDQFTLMADIFHNDIYDLAVTMYSFIPDSIRSIMEQVSMTFIWKFGFILLGSTPIVGKVLDGIAGHRLADGAAGPVKGGNPKEGGGKAIANGLSGDAIKKWIKGSSVFANVSDNIGNGGTIALSVIALLINYFLIQVIAGSIIARFVMISIVWLVLMLSLMFIFFRIFVMFINSYIQILILVVFSPFILLLEMVPGKSSFADWLKSLFFHLSTFPIFITILLLSRTIMAFKDNPQGHAQLWGPPFLWGMDANSLTVIIAGALLFMTPDLVKKFKEMTGIKPVEGTGLKLGAFFVGGTGLLGGAATIAGKYGSIGSTLYGASGGHIGKVVENIPGVGGIVKKFDAQHAPVAEAVQQPSKKGTATPEQ